MSDTTAAGRRVEYMPLAEVRPALRNPKKHDAAGLTASIGRFGVAEVPLLDERTGRLVAGHGRVDQLTAMCAAGQQPPDGVRVDGNGRWLVPILRGWASRSDHEAEAYLVASNSLSSLPGWEDEGLAGILSDLRDVDPDLMTLTGYDDDSLEELLTRAGALGDDAQPPGAGQGLPPPGDAPVDELHCTWGVIITCRDESEQVQLLRRLTEEGREVRALIA